MRSSLLILFVGVVGLTTLTNCEDPNIIEFPDPAIQYKVDIDLIDLYLTQNELDYTDTTTSGVRVVIFDEGEGEATQENSIVAFDYTVITLVDTAGIIVDTTHISSTIEDVAAEHDVNQDPQVIYTYSSNGWTLESSVTGANYIQGFREGVTSLLGMINEGGYGKIYLPSGTAYGTRGNSSIGPNVVVVFEIYLREVD